MVVRDPAAPVETALSAPASGPVPGEALAPAGEPARVWAPAPGWDRDAKGPAGSHSTSSAPKVGCAPMKLARDT